MSLLLQKFIYPRPRTIVLNQKAILMATSSSRAKDKARDVSMPQQEIYSYEVTADHFIFLSSTLQVDFSLQQAGYFFSTQFSYTFSFGRLKHKKYLCNF